jgi:reactive intermediate/imine deaminase
VSQRIPVNTSDAPAAIGPYSQAVRVGSIVYLSGQIPLDPVTQELNSDEFADQARRVFENIEAVASASGGSLADVVKLTVYLTDLGRFAEVNEIMSACFAEPYPARAAVQVAALPRGVQIEIDAIMALED